MDDYTLAGFELGKLTIAFVISATLIFIIYIIWNSGSEAKEEYEVEQARKRREPQMPQGKVITTLYALELEPGTVVLQSEDGEFFRILKEYEAASTSNRSATAPPPPMNFNTPSTVAPNKHYRVFDPEYDVDRSDSIPLPPFTRVHYQNVPSQPLLHDGEHVQQPLHTAFSEDGTWRPIRTLDFDRK